MDLAIVGAGAAGAAAAYALRDAPFDVTIFEADEGVGGRAASGRTNECRYDYGANYVKADSPRVAELVIGALPTAGLVDVAEPVWTFDASGAISPRDDRDAHKWTYEAGIAELPERLLAEMDGHPNSKLALAGSHTAAGRGGWSTTPARTSGRSTRCCSRRRRRGPQKSSPRSSGTVRSSPTSRRPSTPSPTGRSTPRCCTTPSPSIIRGTRW